MAGLSERMRNGGADWAGVPYEFPEEWADEVAALEARCERLERVRLAAKTVVGMGLPDGAGLGTAHAYTHLEEALAVEESSAD